MLTQSLHSLEGENLWDQRLHGKQKLIGNKKRHQTQVITKGKPARESWSPERSVQPAWGCNGLRRAKKSTASF